MNKLSKLGILMFIIIGGYGYSTYLHLTRFDYLDQLTTLTGVISEIKYLESFQRTITDESSLQDNKANKTEHFIKRDNVVKLISKSVVDSIEAPSFRIDYIYSANKNTVSNGQIRIELESGDSLHIKFKELRSEPKVIFNLLTKNESYSFVPSSRVSELKVEDMNLWFTDLLSSEDPLIIKASRSSFYSDLLKRDIYSVEQILDKNDNELYFFPYNLEYEEKAGKVLFISIVTTIVVFIIFLSLIFNWKGKEMELPEDPIDLIT